MRITDIEYIPFSLDLCFSEWQLFHKELSVGERAAREEKSLHLVYQEREMFKEKEK